MIERNVLTSMLNAHLACAKFADYAPNGLQIEGKAQINHICTAVTASQRVIEQAVTLGADALLVHHGFFWRGEDQVLTGMKRNRIATLLANQMNLYAYHLPLDCHLELGNNAYLGRLLNMTSIQSLPAGKVDNLLWKGELKQPLSFEAFSQQLTQIFQRIPQAVIGSGKPIRCVAWCSGAAQDFIVDAANLGVDAYISGEISERTVYQAQELGIHYFGCGHHATERYGIQALGKFVSEQCNVSHQFIDSDNPV